MSDLYERLQEVLGDTYRLERELGGGGMSRVFLAEEQALNRRVVVKVLPPEMAAGVNTERFRRETQLAASLQHPLIVPILTAAAARDHDGSDLLYYVMPYIEGQSLRERLSREGQLPIDECIRILRHVADALGRAHQLGIVHRDIKPDNVMLSGKHALVTDFGIAKAVSSGQDAAQSGLTQMGMALGTPMYMSPEQAAGDPNADERSDLYSLGVMAYEMVTGRLPFAATTPQGLLAAHVSEAPAPPRSHRALIPAALDALIMQLLAKQPADRPQRAEDVVAALEGVAGSSGAFTPTSTSAVDIARFVHSSSPWRVAGSFAVAGVVLVGVVYLLTMQLGLPEWTIWGAGVMAVLGIVMPVGAARGGRPTWPQTRTTLLTGTGMLGMAVAAHAGMRTLGIGPAATLMTAGQLDERDRIILAQFANHTPDSTIAETVTELFRIDFAQSPSITLMESAQIAEVLRRMQRDPGTPVTEALATEVAQREGVKAVLAGDIRSLGNDLIVSVRVVAAATGETLAAGRETADASSLIEAIDDLSASLRAKVGESLRSIRGDPPLARVTTGSTQALRLFAQADRASNLGRDQRAITLLQEAIDADTLFAMAYRKLAIILRNRNQDPARAAEAFTRAYELRSRLTERERLLAEAAYFSYVEEDVEQSSDAYTALLETHPNDPIALNNLAVNYRGQGRVDDAVELYRRSIALGVAPAVTYMGAVEVEFSRGDTDSSRAMLARFRTAYPEHPSIPRIESALSSAAFDYAGAESASRAARDATRGSSFESVALFELASTAAVQGRMAEAVDLFLEGYDAQEAAGVEFVPQPRTLFEATLRSTIDVRFRDDPGAGVDRLDRMRRDLDYDRLPAEQRDDVQLAGLYARAGHLDEARALLRTFEAGSAGPNDAQFRGALVRAGQAEIALGEGRYDDAIGAWNEARADAPGCRLCFLTDLGRAYAAAGRLDSAVVSFRAYLETPQLYRVQTDAFSLWVALIGLGAAYEGLGEREDALDAYGRFLDLWANADPAMQPLVDEVRARVARLTAEGQ